MWETVVEALLAPIDPSRAHEVDFFVSWHGRLMVFAWGVLIPLGVLIARFFKITPKQDWPRVLDNQVWWRSHLRLQYSGGVLMLFGLALILFRPEPSVVGDIHSIAGWVIVVVASTQFVAGWLRGSKGGPTEPAADGSWSGDHYDMTQRRKIFEHFHKSVGYLLIAGAAWTILTGLWTANAPVWMWLALIGWWALLGLVFALFQQRGMAYDTYQAIWGPDRAHPGNRMKPIGWGISRRDGDKDIGAR